MFVIRAYFLKAEDKLACALWLFIHTRAHTHTHTAQSCTAACSFNTYGLLFLIFLDLHGEPF